MVFRYYTMISRIVNRKLTVSLFRQSIPFANPNPGPIETLIATKLTSEFDPRKVSIIYHRSGMRLSDGHLVRILYGEV